MKQLTITTRIMSNINEQMASEVRAKHIETQDKIQQAASAIREACEAAIYLGQLVEKSQRAKRNTVYQWLSEEANVPGEIARSYLLAHTTNQKRKVHSDRRALQRLGVIESQEKVARQPATKRPQVSLGTKLDRARKSIIQHLEKERRIEDMTPAELSLLKSQMTPLAEVYLKVAQAAT